MAYMGCYKNSPTAGGTDGTLITSDTKLITERLNGTANAVSEPIKLAVRCSEDIYTDGNTTITPTGDNAAMWALAPDNSGSAGTFGDYGAALTITASIDDTNTIFWAKAKSVSTENPTVNTGELTVGLVGYCAVTYSVS